MNNTDILPPPVVPVPPTAPTKFEREKAAFHRLLPKLLADLRGKFVAIHEEKVVGSGDNLFDVANAAYKQFGYQPIYVDLITDEATPPVRIPSPRVLAQR